MESSRTVNYTVEEPASTSVNPTGTPRNESPENPFATPIAATPVAPSLTSRRATYVRTASTYEIAGPRRRFKSSRLIGDFEKPWLNKSKREINWDGIIFYTSVFIGLAIGAYLCWHATRGVPNQDADGEAQYCMIMDDHFENMDNWNYEVQMNGFGTGSFDWTTKDKANSYVDAEGLHIVPTMTLESTDITYEQLVNGHTVNLTTDGRADGKCTTDQTQADDLDARYPCAAVSNATKGQIINPVRSARLNTRGKKTIRYGRVEVTARMPRGDWLWPAIWMMPQDNVYGEWPKSGEIDIIESRGNDAQTYDMGDNLVSSALHWGTASINDRWRRSYGEWGGKRVRYSDKFHTYGLEWSEKYLFTWLDGRLRVSCRACCDGSCGGVASSVSASASGAARRLLFPPDLFHCPHDKFPSAPLDPGDDAARCCTLFPATVYTTQLNRERTLLTPAVNLQQVIFFDFTKNKNLWTYGEFAGSSVNGSVPVDPWSSTGRANTPFDQSFFLILNVAVGSTNGWFPDAVGGKPWADNSETPMRDFWKSNSTWLPSWGPKEERGMVIKSVKMWQEGKC
ncbi:concanavalin A-like lectin/glucanase domain-containing protein [Ilyonectria robusta]|uniref:concanavalin A-like lectin/glucanase domain-containing protein n=1 Tax=Ilyonectria robusta TaxID=1079257 RepID=UPI001E8E70D5|nr:concanavalin A-like lectin/glucanase domain-containing protein [Ilyonectria robusta]KAH8659712.1 concanavalin A-like lectin/glucanase domain-containing protein [Ilyonectria robusta]